MPKPIYLEDIQTARCGMCDDKTCDHLDDELHVHCKVHLSSPLGACFVKSKGVIRITCATCNSVLIEVSIASRKEIN